MYAVPSEPGRVTWVWVGGGMGDLSRTVPLSWALKDSEGVSPVLVRGTDAS